MIKEFHHLIEGVRKMGQIIFQKKMVIALCLVIFLGLAWSGCSTTVRERQKGEPERTGKYYFDDVRIPEELNYKPKKSFVYETPKFKAGILHFTKWRLDVPSLIDFFIYNMEKDNWKLINSYKGKESLLNFSKPDKRCSVRIKEKWTGTTVVEIQLGPLGEKEM
jgi:hypothetical protein